MVEIWALVSQISNLKQLNYSVTDKSFSRGNQRRQDMGKSFVMCSCCRIVKATDGPSWVVIFCNWSTLVFMDVSLHKH